MSAGRLGVRSVQKKLGKLYNEILQNPKIEQLVLEYKDDPELDIFRQDKISQNVTDDVLTFKTTMERSLKYISRLRGKKQESVELVKQFQQIMSDNFPETSEHGVAVAVKRNRHEEESEEVDSKKAKLPSSEPLGAKSKGVLRDIINKLSKNPAAEAFLYPVDPSVYPEYYEVIATPMDISTFKKKLNDYKSLTDALDDLRLIWKNCLEYNLEGSEISITALELATIVETTIEENFGVSYASTNWIHKFRSDKKKRKSSVGEDALDSIEKYSQKQSKTNEHSASRSAGVYLSNSAMQEIVRILIDDKKSLPFQVSVDHEEFPDYYEIVENPMDLSIIRTKVNSGLYCERCEDFIRDVNLIWSNCEKYNEIDSEIVQNAHEMSSRFERFVAENSRKKDLKDSAKASEREDSKAYNVGRSSKQNDDSSDREVISDLLSTLRKFQNISPFLLPVNENDAPGYSEIIENPIDVSTIEKKLKHLEYESLDSFVVDVRRIWSNCKTYNDPDSEIYGWAEICESYFEDILSKKLKKLKRKLTSISNPHDSAINNGTLASAAITSTDLDDGMEFEDDQHLDTTLDEKKKRRSYASHRIRMFKSILKTLSECELSEQFKVPATDPQYYEKVEKPIDLSILKAKIEDYHNFPLSFLHDIQLVFENYLKVYSPRSSVYGAANSMKQLAIETFFKCFPSLQTSKTSLETALQKESIVSNEATYAKVSNNVKGLPKAADPSNSLLKKDECSIIGLSDPSKLFGEVTTSKSDAVDVVELESALHQLVDTEDPSKIFCVRKYCCRKAASLLKETRLPFVVCPDLYEVQNIGELSHVGDNLNSTYLYPVGYCCSRNLRLCLVPDEDSQNHSTSIPFVPVKVLSKIVVAASGISFRLTLENNVTITEASTPQVAWQSIIGKELQVLNCLGSKLHRCRAVFNRLCVSTDAEPFLEQVSQSERIANDYYEIIKSPMWLREIHSRLTDGTYDNEFDFAWDVRLIFRNCRQYNLKGSNLYKAADRLSFLFDRLFIHWVFNVQDKSVEDAAKGSWDDWYYLKYFDAPDPTQNVCSLTGVIADESKLVECSWCENQCLWSNLGLAKKPKSWACKRCSAALETASNLSLNDDPFGNSPKIIAIEDTYSCAQFGNHVFVPANDIAEGWYQAKKKNGNGLKNLFLSPLGYEVSKDDIAAQSEFEKGIDDDLMAARAKEFLEQSNGQPGKQPQPRKKGRKSKSTNNQHSQNYESMLSPIDSKYLEDGRIVHGKLNSFEVPIGYKMLWFIYENEDDLLHAGDKLDISSYPMTTELREENIKVCGFFGLDVIEIRRRLEGLENAIACDNYSFIDAESYRATLIEDYTLKLQKSSAAKDAEDIMNKSLLKARWSWHKQRLYPQFEQQIENINSQVVKSGFQLISSLNVPPGGMDSLLAVWNYIGVAQSIQGYSNVTLTELINSVFPPVSILPTCGQIVFDEMCCIFTDTIFREIQIKFSAWNTMEWQDVSLTNPINILTWPKVAEKCILLLSIPWTKGEVRNLLNSKLYGEPLVQLKILCLLFNHPLIDSFIINDTLLNLKSRVLQSCQTIERKIPNDEFCITLCNLFEKLYMEGSLNSVDKMNCAQLQRWLSSLFTRIGYMPDGSQYCGSSGESTHFLELKERNYGGYTLSHFGLYSEEILCPHSFAANPESPHDIKMKALLSLERTLSLLSSVDTEGLCAQDRLSIYATLVDHCIASTKFMSYIQSRFNEHMSKYEKLPMEEYQYIMTSNELPSALNIPKTAKCHFTGLPFSFLPYPNKWVQVPKEYEKYTTLDFNETKCDSLDVATAGNIGNCVYALKDVVNRIINCSKLSEGDKKNYEEFVEARLKTLFNHDHDYKNSEFLMAKPIGYDINGVAYWLLQAQSVLTIFSFDSTGKCRDPAYGRTHEPCILARDCKGSWYYYPELDVTQLVNSLLPTESTLRLRMIERFGMIRSHLKVTTLNIKAQQQIWFDRKLGAESWISESALYTGQNEAHRCRQLEVLLARCTEIRMNTYYAHMHCFEDDRERSSHRAEREALLKRQRNMKESMSEDTFDCHPVKGWGRLDEFYRIRQLAASTTATRVHSDPLIASAIQSNLRNCTYLKIHKVDLESDQADVARSIPQTELNELLETPLIEDQEEAENGFQGAASTGSRTKPIEQLHLITGEVLRVYPSGKDAASFMNVSQSSISQCLQGKRNDCFGFKWRFYEGPPIDFDIIKDSQTPLSELRVMQLSRNKPVENSEEAKAWQKKLKPNANDEEEAKKGVIIATNPQLNGKNENFCFPSVVQPKVQHHIVTSNKTASAKLVKLKGELLNILFAFPEKALKWAELDTASESMILATGEAASNNVYQSFSGRQDPNVDVERLADKASRKARRRLRRKLALDLFLKSVQLAISPAELLAQTIILEDAIPSTLTFMHTKSALPDKASTCAELAVRLYVLDRSIAYHEIQALENATLMAPFKLRVYLSPRCHANGVCQRFFGHTGKCVPGPPSVSRLPDHFQLAPPQDSFSQQATSRDHSNTNIPIAERRPPMSNSSVIKSTPKPIADILPKLSSFTEKEGLDIENIQPYIPSFQEISNAQWL